MHPLPNAIDFSKISFVLIKTYVSTIASTAPRVCRASVPHRPGTARVSNFKSFRQLPHCSTPKMVRVKTIEIAWHNVERVNQPILSCDFSPTTGLLATSGADKEIKLWRIDDALTIEHVETLAGHARAVNCARWSARGDAIASAGDGGEVLVWRASEGVWKPARAFRGHADDATDVCWGRGDEALASTSVDNSTIVWNVESGQGVVQMREHAHYVQGVAWDPREEFIVTQSPDRTARVYALSARERVTAKNVKQVRVIKTLDDPNDLPGSRFSIFRDDSMTSFFRRPAWSVDGSFVVFPAGLFKKSGATQAMNTTYVFSRNNFETPVMHLPGGETPSVCVRFNPVLFQKRQPTSTSLTDLPYRVIFAICSQDSVTIYDTDETQPIVYVAGIHCTSITDCAWHPDGQRLVITSTDGFASVIAFEEGELGVSLSEDDVPENIRALLPSVKARQPKAKPTLEDPAQKPVTMDPPKDAPVRIAPVRMAPVRVAPTLV